MPGPPPKNPALRQRQNRTATRATLPSEKDAATGAKIPELPPLSETEIWHPMVRQWWKAVWESPMASEYLEADKEALFPLARLHQDFWTAKDAAGRKELAAEIRQQSVRFGLSPIDRRRLQWEVEKGEQAADRTASRRKTKAPANTKKDPRDVLKLHA